MAPPDLQLEVVVSEAPINSKGTTATLTGTVTCNREARVNAIIADVKQRQGLNIAAAHNETYDLQCSTIPRSWKITAPIQNRILVPKPATVSVHAAGCEDFTFTCAGDSFERDMKLRRA